MAKHTLKTLYFHEGTSFHMQGKNFGNKIDISTSARMIYNDETKEIHIEYNGKMSGLSSLSAKNWDYYTPRTDVFDAIEETEQHPLARRGRPAKTVETTEQTYSPDDMSPEAHRARVRAASANSNRSTAQTQQNDDLIQESRALAMGMKHQKTAQVSNPQQVGAMTAVTGKPKAINHAQLKAQVAQEAKE